MLNADLLNDASSDVLTDMHFVVLATQESLSINIVQDAKKSQGCQDSMTALFAYHVKKICLVFDVKRKVIQ